MVGTAIYTECVVGLVKILFLDGVHANLADPSQQIVNMANLTVNDDAFNVGFELSLIRYILINAIFAGFGNN